MVVFTMNEFKTMISRLKEIIKEQLQTDKKVLDKDIATVLEIKALYTGFL